MDRLDLIERDKFRDILNYFMKKYPNVPLSHIEKQYHLNKGILFKTAGNTNSIYMKLSTFDKYCEILEDYERRHSDGI